MVGARRGMCRPPDRLRGFSQRRCRSQRSRTYLTLTVNLLVMAFSLPLRKAFATNLHLPSLPNVTRSPSKMSQRLASWVPADRVLLLGPVGKVLAALVRHPLQDRPLIFCGTTAAATVGSDPRGLIAAPLPECRAHGGGHRVGQLRVPGLARVYPGVVLEDPGSLLHA